jgi:exo-1,4-beta-D-glucosaminidase
VLLDRLKPVLLDRLKPVLLDRLKPVLLDRLKPVLLDRLKPVLPLLLLSAFCYGQDQAPTPLNSQGRLYLHNGWSIQASARVSEKGDVISTQTFRGSTKWYHATVPSTVVGALVSQHVYPDPFYGMNLRALPGCSYPVGANFSNLPMPDGSPFKSSWWYRTQFHLPATYRGKQIWLHFEGINFRANVWLNGERISSSDEMAGTFRTFELNIRDHARIGAMNTVAVEVFPPQVDDLAWTWVDWNPSPPDKNMGILRDVYVTTSGPVTLRYPQVVTRFDQPSLDLAHLTVNVEARNATDREIEGTLRGRIEAVRFSQLVKLGPGETRLISFRPASFPQLDVKHPRIWWPINMGTQNLHDLYMEFEVDKRVSDRARCRFGIRQVTSELDEQKHIIFSVNGRRLLIRGGGWASDMLLRFSPERVKEEFQYVRDMNLNSIRLEGQLQPDYFFDLADEYGILIIAGWCCCSHWEHWQHRPDYQEGPTWDEEDHKIAAKSQADQIRRLRAHPSLLVWMNGSDNPPPPDIERMYVDVLKENQWPNPFLSSATGQATTVTGSTGVKMLGPYEWVPPSYWLSDTQAGGAHGFATEISPGPAVPPLESLRRIIPESHLWPIDDYWNYHAGGGEFKNLNVFTQALNARYGQAVDAQDYALKAQLMAYEGQRAMFEAYGGNRYTSTGVIQWMLNNAWPSMIWHLYDYFLVPAGGYFGTKKACEPIHVQYSYADKSIVAVNSTFKKLANLKVSARAYDIKFVEKFSKAVDVNLDADSTLRVFVLPEIPDLSTTYFLELSLEDQKGNLLSSNFYWLSTKDDVLEPEKTRWYYTPVSSFADMSELKQLPMVRLSIAGERRYRSGVEVANVTVSNPGSTLAFFIRLRIVQGRDGKEVAPALWEDNYFYLKPGQSRRITVRFDRSDLGKASPFLAVDGWNITPSVVALR